MAYEILSESYGARLPKITATADSTDDLVTMGTNYAEGSTCVIGDKTYALDKVQGWVEPGSGGGGGSDAIFAVHVARDGDDYIPSATFADALSAVANGKIIVADVDGENVVTMRRRTVGSDDVLYMYTIAPLAGTGGFTGIYFVEYEWGAESFAYSKDVSLSYTVD